MGRLLIVSNRLPVTAEVRDSELFLSTSAGGLATGLGSFYQEHGAMWIGWPGVVAPPQRAETAAKLLSEFNCYPVFLPERVAERFYEGFTNKTLWPLMHTFPMYTRYSANEWEAYQEANRLFCEAVVELAQPDDTIWVHDYHLMLLPKYLRERLPDAAIGFFLHIPFPRYDVFALLPWHRQLVDSLLACNLVGFHTYEYAQAFLGCVRRVIGYDNDMGQVMAGHRVVQVDVFPMGIDFQRFADSATNPEAQEEMHRIRAWKGPHRLVFSVARLDYTKGIPQQLEAIEEFYARYTQWRGRVVFVVVIVPSREKVEHYALLKREIDRSVGQINSQYGTIEWTPIQYIYRSLSFHELAALYCGADVALITPLRDGMNLIAKEYVASRTDGAGILILSEAAGAAKELPEAIVVNPNSKEEVAEALHRALLMPLREQKSRNRAMRSRLERHDVRRWAERFLYKLREASALSLELAARLLDHAERRELVESYRRATRRLFLLDYDGTLAPFTERPNRARPTTRVMSLLRALASTPSSKLVLLSGRERQSLERWFGGLPITLVAEHGAWVRWKGNSSWEALAKLNTRWKSRIRPILALFVERIPGSSIEEKDFSLCWHYRKADEESALAAARELVDALTELTANLDIHVLPGNKVVEVKSSGVSKGAFYLHYLAREPQDFILAVGDDWTDESLFSTLPENAFSIRVGFSSSSAKFNVESPDEVLALLDDLVS
ncbi:MAG: bifunctional alpha,alpha-trehalose-phosphate synthase (UDP-forming)/trehalose-phosphatase [Chloroflexi bacterium]|nr:bifunctional alpha,alpha-trehalose-phosphate synthase (UDP-forming)/trehalose-phosphatase [Chloroflexota bacterium]